jgi:type II secretory pathway pseudopilin PulG
LAGVTLIELLVALTFIAVFAAGMTSVAIGVAKGNAQARAMDTATFLALDLLEEIRNTAYPTILGGAFPVEDYGQVTVPRTVPPGPAPAGAVTFPPFRRSVLVLNDTPIPNTTRLVVTVEWRGGSVREEMLVAQ